MKTKISAALLMLVVGCATRHTAQLPPQIEAAMQSYHAVTPAMSRTDVYRSLGQPQKKSADGVEQWRTSDGRQVAVLSIRFGPDDTVASSESHVDDPGPFVVQP
ncbi:MAG: hypothetical protein V9H26_05655 [Verrucomicrobiota bacterium]